MVQFNLSDNLEENNSKKQNLNIPNNLSFLWNHEINVYPLRLFTILHIDKNKEFNLTLSTLKQE